MEASNNQGNHRMPSAAPTSGDSAESVAPLKLHLELTLPQELGQELKAWRKTFERFADVMERWLENSLAHPGMPAPPPMPWAVAPVAPPQQLVPSPPSLLEKAPPPTQETLPTPNVAKPSQPILPDEMPIFVVEERRPQPTTTQTQPAESDKIAPPQTIEVRPAPQPIETNDTADANDSASIEEAAVHVQRGERHRAAGQKDQALACYQEALSLDPDCTQAYLSRASIYIEQGRLNEALVDCNSALQREPERAVLYVLRGLVYTRLGNVKRALEEANDAIRFDPQLPSAYMLRGTARFKNGMLSEAVTDVKQAIRLRPNDAKFHAELGRLLAQMGQHEQAARTYAKVLELSPNFHEARLQRGMALREAGEAAEAEAELTHYLRRCPGTAAAHYQRGLCRLAQRNYAQAMTDFDKAIALKPDDEAARAAKTTTLEQWEGTARQGRSGEMRATAATVALAATASEKPVAAAASRPSSAPTQPIPPKSAPYTPYRPKPEPRPAARPQKKRNDDEPAQWVRPAKWVCTVALVGLLGFGGFRLLANFMHNPHKPEDGPPATATLHADELMQRYKSNPASAQAELSDHYIEVNGPVDRTFEDKNPPVLVLGVTRTNATVNCTLKANPNLHQQMMLSRIEGDCQATIIGLCAGLQGNAITLSECRIVMVAKGRGARRR
jgi:tetratricopeptide (TPR) repeat protein